jgi:hypothetical protein
MSIDLSTLIRYWHDRIERDLTPFVDPGTALELEIDGRSIGASWTQRARERTATFSVSFEGGVQVEHAGRRVSYVSFFAGSDMGDLRALAKSILQVKRPSLFVETRARLSDEAESSGDLATSVLRRVLLEGKTADATLVVMVTGEAGAGKTSVLQQLVSNQADQYVLGRAETLFLYVNAQGRALARFNEALATELQDLRAQLTYHAVSTLVRLGLLVPVIDGFDELLGIGGYDDAFSSLAQFIEELDGQGQIIASARSTYYEQEFVARANRASTLGSQIWRQVPVQVLAWGEQEFESFIVQRAAADYSGALESSALRARVERVFRGRNASLRSKPLFVARTVDLVIAGIDLSAEGNLLSQVVEAFVERERKDKLRARSGQSLLTASQIYGLLTDVAEEMWNQEARELDRRSAQELAELALLDSGLDDDALRIVVKRMPDLAFLMPGDKTGSIAFEHETFFYYFLAARFATKLTSDVGIPALLLGRSVLPQELAQSILSELDELSPAPSTSDLVARLSMSASTSSSRGAQVRENAGVLVATILEARCTESNPGVGLRLSNVVVPGASLRGVVIRDSLFDGIEFRRTDLSSTKILNSRARQTTLREVLVDSSRTRLEMDGLDAASSVLGLRITDGSNVRSVYEPHEVHSILESIGAVAPSKGEDVPYRRVSEEILGVLQRFVRAYNRSNPVCTSDGTMHSVFGHSGWKQLQRALVESGVVTIESKATGGPSKTFLRRQVLAEEIMAGARSDARVPRAVEDLWDRLERAFPS